MIHVMTDIETLAAKSTKPALLSIGAVKFNAEGVLDGIHIGIDLESCERAGLDIEAATVMWWFDPKRAQAREELLALDKIDLYYALEGYAMWVNDTPKDELGSNWGKGATFDNVRLKSAFDIVGQGLEYPFTYKQDECYRTFANRFPDIPYVQHNTAHNGLADAESQAKHLIEICKARGIAL